MKFSHGAIDYIASHFKYKTPTPIVSVPTHRSLKRLQTEVQANASSVACKLEAGDHEYLGLVLDDAEYALVPGTVPFLAHGYPPYTFDPSNVYTC